MNIEDIKIDWSLYENKDLVQVLFEKQDQLRQLYGVPICDLDIPKDQQELRAMAWNVVEEASEAIETRHHLEHLKDELADMTAFYIELMIMSGITWEKYKSYDRHPKRVGTQESFMEFVSLLALAINTLKNRYWRKTNVKTDQPNYHDRLLSTIPSFGDFIDSLGLTFKELMDSYLRKHEVNLFRIRSKY